MRTIRLARVLSETWLPDADDETLMNLAYLTGRQQFVTRQERVTYLASKNLTAKFTALLWKAFISEHKVQLTVPAGPTSEKKAIDSRVHLRGTGSAPRYAADYPHQIQAWSQLDTLRASSSPRSGLIVIPTGGGKTATMVRWLLKEMVQHPELRVLWLADQQELVDQASVEFEAQSASAPDGFERLLRKVHSQAGPASALADHVADVVCCTRQSLVGRSSDGIPSTVANYLTAFLARPTVVVVDEAHHAVSPTYQRLIEHVRVTAPDTMFVGLTATPWPSGVGRTKLLRETFRTELVSVTTAALVESGDLARPVIHTVATSARIEVNDDDVKAITAGRDLPTHVIHQLNRDARNAFVVQQWLDRPEQWGKTLVFACDINHADSLGEAFRSAGVTTDVLHSLAATDRSGVLDRFRAAREPGVLVSVGMLLEGVDIPSARTAFLCRPTSSHVAMRQMIGRVLRGVRAGGDAEAHLVDFVDQWSTHVGILSPVDLPDVQVRQTRTGEGVGERQLPPILDDDGVEIGEDLIRSIALAMGARIQVYGITATLTGSRLVGFYDLDTRRIPVFEHAQDAWADLAERALDSSSQRGSSRKALFDDLPAPVPLDSEISKFVDHCRSTGDRPLFVPLSAQADIAEFARTSRGAPAMTVDERTDFMRRNYEESLFRGIYPNLELFMNAVEQESRVQQGVTASGARPEAITAPVARPEHRLTAAERDLPALYAETVEHGIRLLEAEPSYDGLLTKAERPKIDWTRRSITWAWAHYSWRQASRAKGKPIIRINLALKADPSQVSDDLLKFLIWHEVCHHLSLGTGHDSEFRRLESLWPDQARLDHELDTLHERYDISIRRS